jgi:hypothetical protein
MNFPAAIPEPQYTPRIQTGPEAEQLAFLKQVPAPPANRTVAPSAADKLLRGVQNEAYDMKVPSSQVIAPGLRSEIRGAFEGIGSSEGAAYSAAKDSLSKLAAAKKVVDNRVPMQMGNSSVGLMNTIAGAGAGAASYGATGDPLKSAALGLGTAITSKLIRERGPALAANTFHRLSEVLSAKPTALGNFGNALMKAAQRSPEALFATHRALMASDPAYFEMWQRQADAEAVPEFETAVE